MYRALRKNLIPLGAWLLFLVSVLLTGCDTSTNSSSSEIPGNNSPAPVPGKPLPNPTLSVNLSKASTGVNGLNQLRVIAYDIRGAELARQTVNVGQNTSFANLPAGSVQIRAIGLTNSLEILGFSDASAAVPNDVRVDMPALTLTTDVPPPATPGTAFLAFSGLPATYEAGVTYSIEVSAFDAQGQLDASANGSVGLSSSGASAVMPAIGVLFTNGRAVFPSVVFAQGSNGTVTFTASSAGFQPAISPTLPVRSN